MRKLACLCFMGAFFGVSVPVNAQGEKTRVLCDPADPATKCPGTDCICVEDVIEIVFDEALTNSTVEYDTFSADTTYKATVLIEAKSDKVQGWSYGTQHDPAKVDLTRADIEGTVAKATINGGFDATSMVNIQTCDVVPGCTNPVDGGGWISAVVLSFTLPVVLPTGRQTVATADYKLKADVLEAGTLIQISKMMKKKGSPPTALNLTIDGKSRRWSTTVDGWIKKKGEPVVEICDNGIDDDGDTKIDCCDEECATFAGCAKETLCTDQTDNDCDGKTDAADPDCTPVTEICDNGIDDDADTKIDCCDTDCATFAGCAKETACTDGKDNDCDGQTDAADTDCQVTCLDYAYYFGPAATTTTVAVATDNYVVTCRNKEAALGFQLGVKSTTVGATTTWEFTGTLGTDPNRLIELIITDNAGNSQTPATPNKATSTIGKTKDVQRGSAISGFSARDFFAFDLAPSVGGPGFFVGYVADMNPPGGGGQKIPATGAAEPCPVNEILKVTLGEEGVNFRRGDADGNGKLNVTDAVLIIQVIVKNLATKFNCDDMLDANDDGKLTVTDAIPVLQYVFQKGPNLAAPFPSCGPDPAPVPPATDTLSCAVTNCQ